MTLADEIRKFICDNYIKPAREHGETEVTIVSGDVHNEMEIISRMPAVCAALRSKELQHMCNVELIEEIRRLGVKGDSSTNQFVFKIVNDKPTEEIVIQNDPSMRGVEGRAFSEAFENLCREELSKYFGVPLIKGRVQGVSKEFDMVSSDGKIVGDAKYLTMVRGERIPPAKFSVIAEYIWLIEKCPAIYKFLVFGNDRRVPMEWLKRHGHLVKNITFFFLDMQTRKLEKLN